MLIPGFSSPSISVSVADRLARSGRQTDGQTSRILFIFLRRRPALLQRWQQWIRRETCCQIFTKCRDRRRSSGATFDDGFSSFAGADWGGLRSRQSGQQYPQWLCTYALDAAAPAICSNFSDEGDGAERMRERWAFGWHILFFYLPLYAHVCFG